MFHKKYFLTLCEQLIISYMPINYYILTNYFKNIPVELLRYWLLENFPLLFHCELVPRKFYFCLLFWVSRKFYYFYIFELPTWKFKRNKTLELVTWFVTSWCVTRFSNSEIIDPHKNLCKNIANKLNALTRIAPQLNHNQINKT